MTGGNPVFQVRLLGPVQATRDGRDLALGGPRQRAVLALLLLNAGQVVSADWLAEEVWRGSPPPGAGKTLRSYVSRLRGVLGTDAELVGRAGGYAVTVPPEQVDARMFERLVAAGQAVLASGDLLSAAARFGEALDLWRGAALTGVGEVERLAREAARLDELRLAAIEGRMEAEVELGRHRELTGELERLVGEYPLRENLWRLLVLALYRGQRQADALAAYRRARELLADELGLEPGEELRALEQAVLRQEVPPPPPVARLNLPAPLTSFLGRDEELAELTRLLAQARLVTLCGPGGAGKTRLALELAADAADRFADGVWLADLVGISDPGLVAAQVMVALGVRQEAGVAVMEALRCRLRSADLLLVLDNCEHLLDACAALAAALLASSPGLRVVATSREPLAIPGELAYPVPPLAVPPETADDHAIAQAAAVRLFLDRGSTARGGVSTRVAPLAIAGRICRKLDGLPLAIELAAARLGTLSAAEIDEHLADRFRFLAYRWRAADPRHQALQTAMDWSYDLLALNERGVFAELSVFAGSFGLAQAAIVCGQDQAAALEVIDRLAGKSLVSAEPAEDGTRYRLLETSRQYAAARLAEADRADTTRRRHAMAFLALAEHERRPTVLSRDHDNFRAALEWSLSTGKEEGPRLARALGGFWLACGSLDEGRGWLERALAQRLDDQNLRADLLRQLGTVLFETGELEQARRALSEAAEAATAAGAPALHARIMVLLSVVRCVRGESFVECLRDCEAATAVLESDEDLGARAEGWLATGTLRQWLGRPTTGDSLERAIAYARQSGNHRVWIQASFRLLLTFEQLMIPADAVISRAEAMLQEAAGDQWAEAYLLDNLSVQYAYAGRFADARAALARSRSLLTARGAKLALTLGAEPAGVIEMAAGDPATAERWWRDGYEAWCAMDEFGHRSTIAGMLAEALWRQRRLQEAQQMTEEAQAAGVDPDDFMTHVLWRATRARLLACRGEHTAARQLIAEAETLISPTYYQKANADLQVAKAEVYQLAGLTDQAAAILNTAVQFYQDRHAPALAEQATAALASLARHPTSGPS